MSDFQSIKNILLVEDDSSYQELMRVAFEENCIIHNLHIVKNGEEALNFLRRQKQKPQKFRTDLILLDLELPKMHGHELLTIVKQDPELKLIPVIVFTTSTQPQDIVKSYSLKANCYINKPYDLEDFFKLIKTSLRFWLNCAKIP
jgi:CheY-like chemotaxis protein